MPEIITKLLADSRVRSLLFGVGMAVVVALEEWFRTTDFTIWTPVVASVGAAVVAQLAAWVQQQFGPKPETKPESEPLDVPSPPRFPNPLYVVAVLLLIPACASAQFAAGPRAIIQGPTHAIPGEMIVLDAGQSEDATLFRWDIMPEIKGRKQLIVMDGGKRCQVASYGGRYQVTLTVANATGIDSLRWDIVIDGTAPCPEPDPVDPVTPQPLPKPQPEPAPPSPPTPAPEPVVPIQPPGPGRFNIAPTVFDLASKAKSTTRVQDCEKLARECQRIADAEWRDLQSMVAEAYKAVKELPTGWETLQTQFTVALTVARTAGLLPNREAFRELLLELKPAFELAAKVK